MLMMFCIVAADRDTRVAALAQRHEIASIVRTAVCERKYVMYFLGRRQSVLFHALLTKRMRLVITRTNFPPCATVSLIGVWIPLIFIVMMLGDLPVFVAEPTVCQFAAPRIGTRALRLVGHLLTFYRHKKSHRWISPSVARVYTFYTAIVPDSHITSTLIYSHLFGSLIFVKAWSRIRNVC